MAEVDIIINGRNYKVACDDGQEEHLAKLGAFVDERIKELVDAVGQIGDSRLLVMASLLISDELADAERRAQEAETIVSNAPQTVPQPPQSLPQTVSIDEDALAQDIETMAERIEGIADRLEQA